MCKSECWSSSVNRKTLLKNLYSKLMDTNLYVLECALYYLLRSPGTKYFNRSSEWCHIRAQNRSMECSSVCPLGTTWPLQGHSCARPLGGHRFLAIFQANSVLPLLHFFLHISRRTWHRFLDLKCEEFSSVLSMCCVVSWHRSP